MSRWTRPGIVIEPTVGGAWLARDDLSVHTGGTGAKARAVNAILDDDPDIREIVTSGSRSSLQCAVVASVAAARGVDCRILIPRGDLGPELVHAVAVGAMIHRVNPGYSTVCRARAMDWASKKPWRHYAPPGLGEAAIAATAAIVPTNLPDGILRVVIVAGSGCQAAGVVRGLADRGHRIPVAVYTVGGRLSVRVSDNPGLWAGPDVQIREVGIPYEARVAASIGGVDLDPAYEAKVAKYVRLGDLFWITGRSPYGRGTP